MPGGDGAASEPLAGGDARGGLICAFAKPGARLAMLNTTMADSPAGVAEVGRRGC